MTSSVPSLVLNPLISLASPVASSVPSRFIGRLQHIDIVSSPVLASPLSRNPHTPRAQGGPLGRSLGLPFFPSNVFPSNASFFHLFEGQSP
jgi:hypothetical protein